jgi:small subunit ribosomal protein S1
MAALLEEESAAYPELRRGEIVEGVVVGTDRDGILVDIGAKSEGVVPPHEMHCLQPDGPSRLRPGDKVLVFILQPESQEGQIILSLDRARGERGWRVLQDYMDANQSFEGYVTGSNKGGLLVNVEGVNAFVPLSQIVAGPDRGSPEATQKALSEWVGKSITLKVIELNRRRNRAILSERSAVQEKRAADRERLLQELQEGDVRTGRVTSIRDFGIFVDIGGADGLVHLSELSWERTPRSPGEIFRVGDEVPVYVLKVDNDSKKIALSVRRAQPERWEEIVSRYREGQVVPGQVTKLAPFGAFVRLEGPIEGLIHISELVDRRITHPREVVQEGDVAPVKIVRIEYDRHRLGLSLRQARAAAEEDGWEFNDFGSPRNPPQYALERLGVDRSQVQFQGRTQDKPEAAAQDGEAPAPAAAAGAEQEPVPAAGPAEAEAPVPALLAAAGEQPSAMAQAMQAAEATQAAEASMAAAVEIAASGPQTREGAETEPPAEAAAVEAGSETSAGAETAAEVETETEEPTEERSTEEEARDIAARAEGGDREMEEEVKARAAAGEPVTEDAPDALNRLEEE